MTEWVAEVEMKRWEQNFFNHPIHGTLTQLEGLLGVEASVENSEAFLEIVRIRKVLNMIGQVLEELDPDLAPLVLLKQLHDQISNSNIVLFLERFNGTGDVGYLIQANEAFDHIFPVVYQLSSLRHSRSTDRADVFASSKTFEGFVKVCAEYLASVKVDVDNFSAEIGNFRESTSYIKSEISKIESNISGMIGEWSSRVNESINQYSTKFTDNYIERQKEFSSLIGDIKSEWRDKSSEFYREIDGSIKETMSSFSDKIQRIIADSEVKHSDILKFYGLVAQDSVTGGYKKNADDEESQANFWRWSTVGCILLAAVWIIVAIFCLKPDTSDLKIFWSDVVKGVSLTTLLVSAAVYTSRQSAIHRSNARRARYFFLQVQAFDPFISSLPEDSRVALKESMSEKIFKGEDDVSGVMNKGHFGVENAEKAVGLLEKISAIFKK